MYITESILERNLTNVNNVARPLPGPQPLQSITEFILERNLINVKLVVKPSVLQIPYEIMKELIHERNVWAKAFSYFPMKISNVRKQKICCIIFHGHVRMHTGEEL